MEKLTNEFKIEYTKGDTYALAIKFKNITEDLRTAYLTVKDNPDDKPLIQKSLGAGIDKIDDRAYKNEKTYKIQLQPVDTINIEPKVQYLYDIQVTVGNVVKTVLHGIFVLSSTITGTSGITTQNIEVAIDDELETELTTTKATNGVEYEQDPVACAKIGDMTTLETSETETIVKALNGVNNATKTNENDIYNIVHGDTIVPNANQSSFSTNATNILAKDGRYKALATALLEMVYPVGSIKMTTTNTNPSTYLGGTWENWGSGRVPVGVDTTQTEFATIEKTGGYKLSQLPYHTHNTFGGAVGPMGVDSFVGGDASSLEIANPDNSKDKYLITVSRGDLKHVSEYVAKTGSNGSTTASNLQPYITCYMWKRTA